jgi:hypothetical protein
MNTTTGIQMVVVALIIAPAMPIAIAAQDHPSSDDRRRHYESNPGSNVINDRGAATRVADTSTPDLYDPNCASGSCPVIHRFVWTNGKGLEINRLPGGDSSFQVWINHGGLSAGTSQNGVIGPMAAFPQYSAVLWNNTSRITELATLGAQAARDRWTATHVRSDNDLILEVLRYAIVHSPSFVDLIDTLDQLDRVVYIEEGSCHHRELRACLQMMSTPGGKNLLVRVDPRQPTRSVVTQLAHELYHAVEIAREPAVVDVAALRDLYKRIGQRSCFNEANPCWETRAAVAFEALVARQLSQASGKSHRSQ